MFGFVFFDYKNTFSIATPVFSVTSIWECYFTNILIPSTHIFLHSRLYSDKCLGAGLTLSLGGGGALSAQAFLAYYAAPEPIKILI